MRSLKTGSALVVLAAGMLQAVGCFNAAEDPDRNPKLRRGRFSDPAGSGGASSSSTGTSGLPPGCAGDPTTVAMLVTEECGVFVQADATGSVEDGTQGHPFKTLQKAIDNAGGRRVYACSSAPYSEAVTIAAPIEMYGGFECTKAWAWKVDARSALNGPAGSVALTVTKQGDGAKVQGFAITAANAIEKGSSSIAVAVDDIAAALTSCEVTAEDGMPGEDGVTPAGAATKGADAPPQVAGTMDACINPSSLVGGVSGVTSCKDGDTAGGIGGKGGITGSMNGDGATGVDGTLADAGNGKGGAGQTVNNVCAVGAPGKDGTDGVVGDAGHWPGALSLKGVIDTDMTDGKPGTRGNGGGGGGGAKSGAFCVGGVDGNGASGGGGGAGGCGGKGGGGGKAGGSSIAIVSLGTKLKLTKVVLKTGKGGDGGIGVAGQGGGDSGTGAKGGAASGTAPSKPGCQGGNGGLGGSGGFGGGGRGGHSVGIAYAAPSNAPEGLTFTGGTAGPGGSAGPNNPSGNGASGAAAACWDFQNDKACQ